MNGMIRTHGVEHGENLLNSLNEAAGLGLRTVKELKGWDDEYNRLLSGDRINSAGQSKEPNVDAVSNVDAVLSEVAVLVRAFNETPGNFVNCVVLEDCLVYMMFSSQRHRGDSDEVAGSKVEVAGFLTNMSRQEGKGAYYTAVLADVKETISGTLTNIPGDLGAHVRSMYKLGNGLGEGITV